MPGQHDVPEADLGPARVVWDFLRVESPLQKCDGLLCLGSSDIAVADWAARYFLEGWVPWILFTGNVGRMTDGVFLASEAETFAARAVALGVPADKIMLEARSTNTGENIRFSKELLAEKSIPANRLLVVQKPYMGKRALATIRRFWPELEAVVRSTEITLEEYLASWPTPTEVVQLMVGDLQRMKVYPPLGFQAPVDIPDEVWAAFEELVKRGYGRQLVRES